MEFITLNQDNIDKEHICCSLSGVEANDKKAWLKEQFSVGLTFLKANIRGKVFIEYLPSEEAWSPINAPNYFFINCFWVSGKYKGTGLANQLLEKCIKDAKDKNKDGLVVLSTNKKKPFLSDPSYLKYKGFLVADTLGPYYELLYLPLNKNAVKPTFTKLSESENTGFALYYTNQCPFAEKSAHLIASCAKENSIPFTLKKINNKIEAQNAPNPFTTYSLFYQGKFITNEILSTKKFLQLANKKIKGV